MKELLNKAKELLILAKEQLNIYPNESNEYASAELLISDLENFIQDIEPKAENIMFLEFSIKNRIDVVENMPLVFNVFNRTFTTIIGDIEDNIKHFFEVSGYSKMIYFFQKIDPINNEITFYAAWNADKATFTNNEVSLMVGTKKYTFGAVHFNKIYARADDSDEPIKLIEQILDKCEGFALSYNILGLHKAIDTLYAITKQSSTLADLRFLNPKAGDLEPLVNKFKGLKWKSIMTQKAKYTLLPNGSYSQINFK